MTTDTATMIFADTGSEQNFSQSNTNIWMTSLRDALVQSSRSMTIKVKTVENSNLSGLGAYVGVWQGTGYPTQSDFVATTKLKGTSDGNYHEIDLKVDKPGVDLIDGTFTAGVFLKGSDLQSLSATVNLMDGQPLSYKQTTIFVTNVNNRTIQVSYNLPDLIRPHSRLDWIFFLKGNKPVMDNRGRLAYGRVPTNASRGIVDIDVSRIQLDPGQYIVQYNPGRWTSTVAAAYSFSIR